MTKIAFLFPGQGSQRVAMGRDFHDNFACARAVFQEADEALGFSLSKLIFEGPEEELKLTEHTQPAILTASVAVARVLAEKGVVPEISAGHSLGEYSAHVVAGTLSFADAVRAVRLRGRYMQEAVPAGEGAMAAILGMPAERINELCGQASDELTSAVGTPASMESPSDSGEQRAVVAAAIVSPANLNSPEQTVISGSTHAVERAAQLCKAAGAKKTVMLHVSAPFHCKLMQAAQDRLTTDLEGLVFNDPAMPVASNVDARLVMRRAEARDCLIRQVTGTVRWVECVQLLVGQGATHFLEVGPGKVLTGLMRQIDRAQTAMHVEDMAALDKALSALHPA